MHGLLRHLTLSWIAAAAIILPAAGACRDIHPTAPLHLVPPGPSFMVADGGGGCYDGSDGYDDGSGDYGVADNCDDGSGADDGSGDGGWYDDSGDPSGDGSGDDCCKGSHQPDQWGQQDINDAKQDFSTDPSCGYVGTIINRLQSQGRILFYSDPSDSLWGGSNHHVGTPDDPNSWIFVNTGQPAWGDSLSATLVHEAAHIHYGSRGGDPLTSPGEVQANSEVARCGP